MTQHTGEKITVISCHSNQRNGKAKKKAGTDPPQPLTKEEDKIPPTEPFPSLEQVNVNIPTDRIFWAPKSFGRLGVQTNKSVTTTPTPWWGRGVFGGMTHTKQLSGLGFLPGGKKIQRPVALKTRRDTLGRQRTHALDPLTAEGSRWQRPCTGG